MSQVKVGDRFTRWLVASDPYLSRGRKYVDCICDCGVRRPVATSGLLRKTNPSMSCGCLNNDNRRGKIKNPLQIGQRFSRLVVIGEGFVEKEAATYPVRCDCGTEKSVRKQALVSGATQSCGCLNAELVASRKNTLTHGMSGTTEHNAWLSMRRRCYLESDTGYTNYGGRGIKVCDRWSESFENFFEDMGNRPSPGMSVERLDVNGDYTPENCVWADKTAQMFNRRKFKGCKSQYIGVTYEDGRNKPWRVTLKKNKRVVFSGSFYTEEAAARAYDDACEEHYGVRKNFPKKE